MRVPAKVLQQQQVQQRAVAVRPVTALQQEVPGSAPPRQELSLRWVLEPVLRREVSQLEVVPPAVSRRRVHPGLQPDRRQQERGLP